VPWWPQDRWADMKAGIACPMCDDGHLPTNEHGDLIAELPGSYARLHRNQTHAGYSVVIAKRHASELFDLSGEELALFWNEVAAVARSISMVLDPVKLDYLVMGHLCPHVHCHVYPQYENDDPHGLLNPQDGSVRLPEREWAARLTAIRQHLSR
jgi:diadenosine tetraphosphate (Ap4A) HIT family hydrolase